MNLDECILARKSTRRFDDSPVADEAVRAVIQAGLHAPSPKNRQPWEFVVLKGQAKAAVCDSCREVLSAMEEEALLPGELPSGLATIGTMRMAPVLILVFNRFPSDSDDELRFGGPDISNIQAIGAAIQNMLLKATDMGLSSLWMCDILTARKAIEGGYGQGGRLIAGVLLGNERKEAGNRAHATPRLPLDELVRWGA